MIELWSSLHIILIFRFSRVTSIAGIALLLVGHDVYVSAQFFQGGVRDINFATDSNVVELATGLADGTYTDQVYGTTFTVENGILKGTAQAETTYIIG